MEPLPKSARAAVPANSQAFYSSFFSASPIKTRQTTGSRTWDYVLDGGVPITGSLPEFMHDVKISQAADRTFTAASCSRRNASRRCGRDAKPLGECR